jgi:hypothetical protein
MKSEEILAGAAKVLTDAQREFYFEAGYLLLPGSLPVSGSIAFNQ